MPNDILPFDQTKKPGLPRRGFALALGAGVANAFAIAADDTAVETDVLIKMPDGD